MKYRHYILLAFNLLIGGFILWLARFFVKPLPIILFTAAIVAGILILIIVLICKSRGKMTNKNPENQPAIKGLPTATVSVFFALLPVLVGFLSLFAQGIVHDYHWGLGWFNDHAHLYDPAHPFTFFNWFTVWFASAAIFLITALTLVIYTKKLAESKRVSWVWIIVTVITIVAGGMMLLFAGFIGMMGA